MLAGLTGAAPGRPALAGPLAATTAWTTAATAHTTVRVYFLEGEKLAVSGRTVPATKAVARAAVLQLISGPSPADRARGLTTCVPVGTRLLGLSIRDGTATVDLTSAFASGGGSLSMRARLAQLTYTLTQFPTVARARLAMDGRVVKVFGHEGIVLDHPLARSRFEGMAPAILVESPTAGQTVSSPVRIAGSADVFEGVFQAELTTSSGTVFSHRTVQATSGTGTRGTFTASLSYAGTRQRAGYLVVYDLSAKDGSPQHVSRLPLVFAPN
jgi:hypothetical protein